MFPTNMLYCELPGTTTRSVQFFRNVTEPGNILLLVPVTERYKFLAVLGLTINPTETLLLVWCDSSVIIYGPVQTPLHSCAEPNWWIIISTAKERVWSNQFGTAERRTFVELNLRSTRGGLSESDVAPVSLQSRPYSNQLGSAHEKYGFWTTPKLHYST